MVEYLVSRKLEHVTKAPMPMGRVADSRNRHEELINKINTYQKELFAMKYQDLSGLYEQEKLKQLEEKKLKLELEDQSRFFNQLRANADYEHWSKAAYWSLDEAIALSFGKDPNIVNWLKVKPLTGVSKFASDYASRRDLALRAMPCRKLYDPVLPSIFLSWAKELELEIPAALIAEVEKMGGTATNWFEKYQELERKYQKQSKELSAFETNTKPLSTRIENNYLRLIMQLANSNIKDFDPRKPYEAAALIKNNIDTELSEKTIAIYIQKAHGLVSKERG